MVSHPRSVPTAKSGGRIGALSLGARMPQAVVAKEGATPGIIRSIARSAVVEWVFLRFDVAGGALSCDKAADQGTGSQTS